MLEKTEISGLFAAGGAGLPDRHPQFDAAPVVSAFSIRKGNFHSTVVVNQSAKFSHDSRKRSRDPFSDSETIRGADRRDLLLIS
jgi:hypothetical protein